MAKRKRLAPASLLGDVPAGLETKSATAPIAGVAGDAAATAALQEVSEELRAAHEGGRMLLELDLAQIDQDHLVRDRMGQSAEDLDTLMTSLRARGQQTPIEVVALEGGRYGLISGWRRCQALARLAQEDRRPSTVLALLRQPKDAPEAYLAMVEENEIRVGLSYYERARIAVRAVQQGVFGSDREALQGLFGSASRAKRSKIGSFMALVRGLDEALRFPTAIPERLGLDLAKRLAEDPKLADALVLRLMEGPVGTPEAERAVLEARPKTAAPKPKPAAQDKDAGQRRVQLSQDLWVQENADGTLTLGGPALTPAARARLYTTLEGGWLDDQS